MSKMVRLVLLAGAFFTPVAVDSQDLNCDKCCGANRFVYSWNRSCEFVPGGEGTCHVTECNQPHFEGPIWGCCPGGALNQFNDKCTGLMDPSFDLEHRCY